MEHETEEAYEWALRQLTKVWRPPHFPKVFVTDRDKALRKALSTVYPECDHVLCVWHLFGNINTHCRRYFKGADDQWTLFRQKWNCLCNAPDPAAYDEALASLRSFLSARSCSVLDYMENHILPEKEYFVKAWAGHKPHMGNGATSIVESAHAYIKGFLPSAKGDFLTLWEAIATAADNQLQRIIQETATQIQRPFNHTAYYPGIHTLRGRVSNPGFQLLFKQFDILKKSEGVLPCTRTWMDTYGIPCAHEIKHLLEFRGHLEVEDIHPQWRLKYNPQGDVGSFLTATLGACDRPPTH